MERIDRYLEKAVFTKKVRKFMQRKTNSVKNVKERREEIERKEGKIWKKQLSERSRGMNWKGEAVCRREGTKEGRERYRPPLC